MIVSGERQVFFKNCSNCRECFSLDGGAVLDAVEISGDLQTRRVGGMPSRGNIMLAVLVLGMTT